MRGRSRSRIYTLAESPTNKNTDENQASKSKGILTRVGTDYVKKPNNTPKADLPDRNIRFTVSLTCIFLAEVGQR